MYGSLQSRVRNEMLTVAACLTVTAFVFSIACRFDTDSLDNSGAGTTNSKLTVITPPGPETVSWDGIGRPSCFPGRPGLPGIEIHDRPEIEPEIEFIDVLDGLCGYMVAVLNESGIDIWIYGSAFEPGEVVTLTVLVDDLVDVVGDVATNELGQFLAEMTLAPNEYMIGHVGEVVANGARGSRASIELPIVGPDHFDDDPQGMSDTMSQEVATVNRHYVPHPVLSTNMLMNGLGQRSQCQTKNGHPLA